MKGLGSDDGLGGGKQDMAIEGGFAGWMLGAGGGTWKLGEEDRRWSRRRAAVGCGRWVLQQAEIGPTSELNRFRCRGGLWQWRNAPGIKPRFRWNGGLILTWDRAQLCAIGVAGTCQRGNGVCN